MSREESHLNLIHIFFLRYIHLSVSFTHHGYPLRLLLLISGGGVDTCLDEGGSSFLPEFVQGAKESIFRGSVGFTIPFLIVPTRQRSSLSKILGPSKTRGFIHVETYLVMRLLEGST